MKMSGYFKYPGFDRKQAGVFNTGEAVQCQVLFLRFRLGA